MNGVMVKSIGIQNTSLSVLMVNYAAAPQKCFFVSVCMFENKGHIAKKYHGLDPMACIY